MASQDFDAEKAAQLALGWALSPSYDVKTGVIRLDFVGKDGKPVVLKDLQRADRPADRGEGRQAARSSPRRPTGPMWRPTRWRRASG